MDVEMLKLQLKNMNHWIRLGLEKQAKEIISKHRFLHQKLYDNLCELQLEL